MSADLLRRAAADLRESVKGVPPGFWSMRDGWGPDADGDMHVSRVASDEDESTVIEALSGDLCGHAATFELIAVMACPPVALALAECMDKVAQSAQWDLDFLARISNRALFAVARAILREES